MKHNGMKKDNIFKRGWSAVKDAVYDLHSAVCRRLFKRRGDKPVKISRGKKKKLAFYIAFSAPLLLQFLIFYVYVNFNSVLMAFQKYDYTAGIFTWAAFDNFTRVFNDIFVNSEKRVFMQLTFKNSFIVYAVSLIIGTTLSVLFSFYVYKKAAGSRLFKIALFFPSILSGVALVTIYRNLAELGVPAVWNGIFKTGMKGLIGNPNTVFGAVLFFGIFTGFGTTVLMYTGAMSSINDSVVEAAKLDGASAFRELIHITLPSIYPTFVTFIVAGIAGIFLNQMSLFTFFGYNAESALYTVGYFIYRNTLANVASMSDYPYIAAFGVLLTVILVPVAFTVRKLLEKFGPSTD